jgi:hypothetical protein
MSQAPGRPPKSSRGYFTTGNTFGCNTSRNSDNTNGNCNQPTKNFSRLPMDIYELHKEDDKVG